MKKFIVCSLSVIFLSLVAVIATPTFSQAQNSITVVKATTPAGQGPFDFTSTTAPTEFELDGGEQQLFDNLADGVYTITEMVPMGTDLVITSNEDECDGSDVVSNNLTGVSTITLDDAIEACDMIVTYTNNGNATIRINKITDPVDNAQQFGFTSDIPGESSFTITSATGLVVQNVLGGVYTVVENVTPGYTLTNITCNSSDTTVNLGNRSVTIEIDEDDDDITCNFTNTANGTIVIEKITDPAGATNFTFDEDITAPDGTFMLNDGQNMTFTDVAPGTYTVSERDPSVNPGGFFLSDLVCNDMGSTTNLGTRTVTIDLDADESVSCSFTNTAILSGLSFTTTDDPDPVVAGQQLRYESTIINNTNFTATDVLFTDNLPDGVIGDEILSNIPGVDCVFDTPFNPNNATCEIPDMAPGQEVSITVVVTPDPDVFNDAPTIIVNNATLNANPGNVELMTTTLTLVNPVVSISIDPEREEIRAQRNRTFTAVYDITVNPINGMVTLDNGTDEIQVRADALDVMFEATFPPEFNVDSVISSQGICTIGTDPVIICSLGDINEGQTATITIIYIAPNQRGNFVFGSVVTSLLQTFDNFIFVSVRGDGSDCSIAAAGATGASNLLYLLIPMFIFTRRYWKKIVS